MKRNLMLFLLLLAAFLSAVKSNAQTPEDSVTYMLDEVVVKVDPSLTKLKGNALLTRVSGTQLEHAGTANDVLKQVPMVLGENGNFEVFGKGAPAIYVNGRIVEDLSELSQINSANIKNVEVVTSPGAKYDASVKAVINIRTKAPQGDGFSGTLRAQATLQKYFRTLDQINLKYRTGGLEAFANFGYLGGKFETNNSIDYLTRSSVIWNQKISMNGHSNSSDFYGKAGFSYMFNSNHSIGAYYSNGFTDTHGDFSGTTSVWANDIPFDKISIEAENHKKQLPKHHANLYYNGQAGKWGVDFNMDYMWRKDRSSLTNNELSQNYDDNLVTSLSNNHSSLFAEKLIFSYPFWNGGIEFGEEYTSSRFSTDYSINSSLVRGTDTRVDENNIAGFVELGQQFGMWSVSAGVRYEHVKFKYMENGQNRDDMTRTYNNIFPSLSVSTMFNRVQMALSYTNKIQRPSYDDLDGAIDYINRFTLEGGNPYLKPANIHNIQLSGAWSRFFGQLSYSYIKNPILHSTIPYSEDGEVKLIIKENFPKMQKLEAFIGSQFQLGVWQPKVNLGIIKHWFTFDYDGHKTSLDNPIGLVQWQNAIHLPADIWLNVDLQWKSAGNGENAKVSASSYLNAKLYKAFFNNQFSISFEANDIFNKNRENSTLYSHDVTVTNRDLATSRAFILTLQYSFNTSRDRYKGRGAGIEELNRF